MIGEHCNDPRCPCNFNKEITLEEEQEKAIAIFYTGDYAVAERIDNAVLRRLMEKLPGGFSHGPQ